MKKRIYEIIELAEENDKVSRIYDIFMMIVIAISIVPLAFKGTNIVFQIIDKVTVTIFIIDYFLRLITANLKFNKGVASYFLYPITPMGIIDLLSIIPSLVPVNRGFKLLRLLRILKTFRIFKVVRYSKSMNMIINVFKKQRKTLLAMGILSLGYVLVSALIILNAEPQSFNSFFDAIYWATVSLTTMGYGDIYPVTTIGRIITMASSIFGIAIVALPSGVITSSFLEEIYNKDNND